MSKESSSVMMFSDILKERTRSINFCDRVSYAKEIPKKEGYLLNMFTC